MSEPIPFGRPWITDEDRQAVLAVLDSPILTHGPQCHAFETAFSAFIGGGKSVTTSSCTTALQLFGMHYGFKAGDDVIMPAISHVATAHAVEATGARPIFIDVTAETGCMDPTLVEAAITTATKAICVVHFNGMPTDMSAIMAIARRHNLPVLEDCATALGGYWDGTHVGLFGEGGAFSFYPAKHITAGEGGMYVSKDPGVSASVTRLRAFCYDRSLNERALPGLYDVDGLGLNFRMSELQAALGLSQLSRIQTMLDIRRRNAGLYASLLSDHQGITVLNSRDSRAIDAHYCLTVVLDGPYAGRRDDMLALLKERGLGTSVHYPHPLPRLKYYREKYGYDASRYPNAQRLADQSLNLPVAPHIEPEMVQRICEEFTLCLKEVRQ